MALRGFTALYFGMKSLIWIKLWQGSVSFSFNMAITGISLAHSRMSVSNLNSSFFFLFFFHL